jgi:hypothetical protein
MSVLPSPYMFRLCQAIFKGVHFYKTIDYSVGTYQTSKLLKSKLLKCQHALYHT